MNVLGCQFTYQIIQTTVRIREQIDVDNGKASCAKSQKIRMIDAFKNR